MKKAPYLVALASSLLLCSATLAAEASKRNAKVKSSNSNVVKEARGFKAKADEKVSSSETKADNEGASPDTRVEIKITPPKEAIASSSKFADDVMSKAMEDELLRSVTDLKISGRQSPYFVSYLATESQGFTVYGSFGALDQVTDSRHRSIQTDVRVGDYKLDSSGKRGFLGGMGRRGSCSIDDNYDAIRHELWLGTDYGYKRAIEALDNKKAILQQKKVEDLPNSMTPNEPVVSMKPAEKLDMDKEVWKNTVRTVSGVFREYPAVLDSTVALIARARTRWFANTEGSLNRECNQGVLFGISANGQAADGMRISDFEVFAARDTNAIPTREQLEQKAKELALRVKALTESKAVDEYRGPILFEKQAAAELFAQALAPRLTNKVDGITAINFSFEPSNDKIGRRILPPFISVIDDPLAREFKGQQLKGGYDVDDEGVKAQRVTLVENGYLKTFCSGRTPSRDVKQSNGHFLDGAPTTTQLFIESSKTDSLPALKEKLIALGKEEALDYVLIVRHISSGVLGSIVPGRSSFSFGRGNEVSISAPTLLYKVYIKDGHEELVRGANFTRLSNRLFRDIQAVGDDAQAYPVKYPSHYGTTGSSVITPSVLISEVDIERESHETDMPMMLKNSYFDNDERPRASNQSPHD